MQLRSGWREAGSHWRVERHSNRRGGAQHQEEKQAHGLSLTPLRVLAPLATLAGGCAAQRFLHALKPVPWPLFVVLAALALTGCTGEYVPGGGGLRVARDEQRGVTCWLVSGTHEQAISCLPDSALKDGGP